MSKFHLKKAVAETPLCCYLLDVEKTLNLNEIRIIFDSTGVVINIFEEFCCVRVPDSFWSKFLLEIFESPLNHFFHDELLCDNNGQIVSRFTLSASRTPYPDSEISQQHWDSRKSDWLVNYYLL